MLILICNAGSTSLKSKLWEMPGHRALADGKRVYVPKCQGRLMLAVSRGERLSEVMASDDGRQLRASMPDPAMLTLGARVDAWVKIGSMDSRAVGTDFWYEQMGVSKPDRSRLAEQLDEKEKRQRLDEIRELLTAPTPQQGQSAQTTISAAQMKPNTGEDSDHDLA